MDEAKGDLSKSPFEFWSIYEVLNYENKKVCNKN